jgi:hypothetical protein
MEQTRWGQAREEAFQRRRADPRTDTRKFLIAVGLVGGLFVMPIILSCWLSPAPAPVTTPEIASTVQGDTPPKVATARSVTSSPHRRHRRRHHQSVQTAPVDPLASEPTLHLVKLGKCWNDEIGISHVSGLAINNTGRDLSYAQVTIRLLDSSGSQVGSALANTNNLPAGATWRFVAMGAGEGATTCAGPDFEGF